MLATIFSCGKKNIPQHTTPVITILSKNNTATVAKVLVPSTATINKTVAKKTVHTALLHKVIIVNDNAAKKSFDGRLYYDVEGHRYWKNYSDGKYYLFNKSMYSDSNFKPH